MKHLGKQQIPEVDSTRLLSFDGVPLPPASGSTGTAQIYYDGSQQKLMSIKEGGTPQEIGAGGGGVSGYSGYSGTTGLSGYSGSAGGLSGYSGYSGAPGVGVASFSKTFLLMGA